MQFWRFALFWLVFGGGPGDYVPKGRMLGFVVMVDLEISKGDVSGDANIFEGFGGLYGLHASKISGFPVLAMEFVARGLWS